MPLESRITPFKRETYHIEVQESEFATIFLMVREIGRVMQQYDLDTHTPPKATLRLSLTTTSEAAKAALEEVLDDLQLTQIPMDVEVEQRERKGGK